jgi:hypothetical protein
MLTRCLATGVILWWSLMAALPCRAGVLLSLGGSWNNFVFEPKDREDTPNYYGYGGRGAFGYSVAKVWDVAFFGQYTPARLDSASATDADATLTQYGVETGIRIYDVLYLGGRGGFWDYRLRKRHLTDEVDGSWSGLGAQGAIGLILPVGKEAAWQTTMDVGQAVVAKMHKSADDVNIGKRTLAHISVTVSFVYNSLSLSSREDSILNSFVKSLF